MNGNYRREYYWSVAVVHVHALLHTIESFFFFFFFLVAHVLIIPFLALFFFFSPGALGHTHGSPRMTSKSPTSERPLSLVTVSEPVLSDVFETANSPV